MSWVLILNASQRGLARSRSFQAVQASEDPHRSSYLKRKALLNSPGDRQGASHWGKSTERRTIGHRIRSWVPVRVSQPFSQPPLLQFGQHLLGEKAQTLLLVRPDLVDEDVVIASDVIGSDRLQVTGEKRARRSELIIGDDAVELR
jgi:hypothetical protein